MKNRNIDKYDDFNIIISYENLLKAHRECRKGKVWKDSVAHYDLRTSECTLYLKNQLLNGEYKINGYHKFTLNERGKERHISATPYQDRVVQKNLIDNIIVPAIQPMYCYENSCSQKNKGTDFALELFRKHLRNEINKRGVDGYILVADFKSYFDTIRHDIVNDMYAKYFKDEKLLNLIKVIHESTGEIGVPLGNQLSQNDALMITNPLDHYIKEVFKIKGYGRYNDDFYLIHHDKDYLIKCLEYIKQWSNDNGLKINTKKTKIVPMRTGVNFLGFRFYVTEKGKIIMKIKPQYKKRWRDKIKKHFKKVKSGEMSYKSARESFECRKAHANRGNSYYLIQDMTYYFYSKFYDYLTDNEKLEYIKLEKQQNARRLKKNVKTIK